MTLRSSGLEPELESFLKHLRIERSIPGAARMRVLTRARALVASEKGMAASPLAPVPEAWSAPMASGRTRRRIAAAAALMIAGGTVAAVAALREARRPAPHLAPVVEPVAAPAPKRRPAGAPPASPETVAEPAAPAAVRAARPAAKGDPFRAELRLLQRAHAAYKRSEYAPALALLSEHARRFPRGSLAEQREALRVRSLDGAGRTEEARRATAAFAARFPRSVLLSHLEGSSETTAP